MLWWQHSLVTCVILLVSDQRIKKTPIFAADTNRGALSATQIERQAEIKPFAPDTDNAETGNRVPHLSSIDLLNY